MIAWLAAHGPSLATVGFFLAFVGIGLWAYAPRNKARFERCGRIPLEENPHG